MFNLENYAPVEDRIAQFYERFPDGRIVTELLSMKDGLCVVKAEVFRDREAPPEKPDATGLAYEREGSSPVNKTSYVENCETSAVGRALANLNFPGKIDGVKAPRPSREEMQKVERNTPAGTPANSTTDEPSPDAPDCPVCSGAMWDNRGNKRNPRAPDFKCKDKACDGAIWPPKKAKGRPVVPTGGSVFYDDEDLAF